MWQHFERVGQVQTAVIDGDLGRARMVSEVIAMSDSLPDLPDRGRPYEAALRSQALIGATAPDLAAASRSVGQIGRSCGECHAALQRGPRFGAAGRPITSDQPATDAMLRHRWAADQMWAGLIGPSDSSWQAGTRALSEESTYTELIKPNVPRGDAMRALAISVQQMGRTAGAETDADRRAILYGRLLVSCTGCHELSKAR
jgi:mono/diheme cytochrome c family protein